jgi:competence protein ComEC
VKWKFERHTLYILVLSLLALTARCLSSPYLPFIAGSFLFLLFLYARRFCWRDLTPGFLVTLLLLLLFHFVSPLSVPGKVVWLFEGSGDERIALLSDGRRVRLREPAELCDIVDEKGHLLLKDASLTCFFQRWRYAVYRRLKDGLDYPFSAVSGAVTLGVRYELPYSLRCYFLLSGLYPLLAISGLHIGVVTGVLVLLLRTAGVRKPLTGATLLLLPFMPLTGLSPSALRAYGFAFLVALGIENHRKVDAFYTLGLLFFISAVAGSLGVSGVLSFVATAGVLTGVSAFKGRLAKLLAGSLAPFLFTLPVVLHNFGTVNILSPVNSVVALPVFTVFLLPSFANEVTMLKVGVLRNLLELSGYALISLSQHLFELTRPFVFHSKLPLAVCAISMLSAFFFLLAGRRLIAFVPLVLLGLAGYLTSPCVSGSVKVSGRVLNTFRFISSKGQALKSCTVHSDYILPVTKKLLPGVRFVDERLKP